MKRYLQIITCILGWLAMLATANADQNLCTENGPHYNGWQCIQSGAIINTGFLEVTNVDLAPNETFPIPQTYYAEITTGLKRRWVWYDCSPEQNHYETNVVSYSWANSFQPNLPTSTNVPGTYTYSVTLVGTPIGGTCGTISAPAGTYTVKVWANTDSDYDGAMDWQEAFYGTDPYNPVDRPGLVLGHWGFETLDCLSDSGAIPLVRTNLELVVGYSGYAVRISDPSAAQLAISEYRADGKPNINLAAGTIGFWFKPDWNSASSGGTGPQTEGRLIEIGNESAGTPTGWWTLKLDSNGNQIRFITQTNGAGTTNLTAAINWTSNTWYKVALTYGPSNSVLYINGQFVANGLGVINLPSASVRSNGFRIGADANGQHQAKGRFDDLETFTPQFASNQIAEAHAASTSTTAPNQNTCDLRPIAIPNSAIATLNTGDPFTLDLSIQHSPGNFGWLVWNKNGGGQSVPRLENSLLNPDSDNYVNPRVGGDNVLNAGDWVSGVNGEKGGVKDALEFLKGQSLILPVYSNESTEEGDYHISGFVNVTLTSVSWGNSKSLTFAYIGTSTCDARVNVPPTIAFSDQAISQYVEDEPPKRIDPAFELNDPDFPNSPDFDGGSLTVSITANASADDHLTISSVNGITISGSSVSYQGNSIGSFSGGQGTTPLAINFSGSYATPDAARVLMQAVTYQNISENPSGTRTIEVVANDGDGTTWEAGNSQPAIITISLSPVNDAPTLTVVNLMGGAPEDTSFPISYANLAVHANEADVDSNPIYFRVVDVTSGTLTIGGNPVVPGITRLDPTGTLQWLPPKDANGILNAFRIKADDGLLLSTDPIQVKVNVPAVNDAPTLTEVIPLTGASEDTVFEIDPYTTLIQQADEADVDGPEIYFNLLQIHPTSGTLTINGVFVDPADSDSIRITPEDTLEWLPDPNENGPAINAFVINADDGFLVSTPGVQVKVNVAPVNDAPTLTAVNTLDGASENTPFQISYDTLALHANEADIDSAAINFRVINITTGTLTKNGMAVSPGETPSVQPGDLLAWTPPLDASGPALNAFTIKADDGQLLSAAPAQVKVNVECNNQPPTILLPGAALSYSENGIRQTIDPGATCNDADSSDFGTGSLTVQFTANGSVEDELGIRHQGTGAGQIGISGTDVKFGNITVGTFSGGTATAPLVITFNSSSTAAAVSELLRNITYFNGSGNPSALTRTVQFVMTDGGCAPGIPVTKAINVININDPPVVDAGYDQSTGLESDVDLNGSVFDDGQRLSPTVKWVRIDGPNGGVVTFDDPASPMTKATFSKPGEYQLRLTAFDGEYASSDETTVSICNRAIAPLDVVFVFDESESQWEGVADQRSLVSRLIDLMRFSNAVDSDQVGVVTSCGLQELSNDPTSAKQTVDRVGSPDDGEGLDEFKIEQASQMLARSGRDRTAIPVMVLLSDDFPGAEYPSPSVTKAKAAGIRIITVLMYGPEVYYADFLKAHADFTATPGDGHFFPDLASTVEELRPDFEPSKCFGENMRPVVFSYSPSTVKNDPQNGNRLNLNGKIWDDGLPEGSFITPLWTQISGPGTVTFSSINSASTEATFPTGIIGDYILRLSGTETTQGNQSFDQSYSDVTVHVVDQATPYPSPVPECDRFTVLEDSVDNILDLLQNDIGPDGKPASEANIHIVSVSGADHGKVSREGDIVKYTPDPDFCHVGNPEDLNFYSDDYFSYVISDGQGGENSGTVQICVMEVNDPPLAHDDNVKLPRGLLTPYTLDVLANDTDVDIDPNFANDTLDELKIISVTPLQPNRGSLSIDPDRKHLSYIAEQPENGNYTVTFGYTISDHSNAISSATVTLNVTDASINALPITIPDFITVRNNNSGVLFNVLLNDSDPDGQRSDLTIVSIINDPNDPAPDLGQIDVYDDFVQVYYPDLGGVGIHHYNYIIEDLEGGQSSGTLTINVVSGLEAIPPPMAVDDSEVVNKGGTIAIQVLDNDSGAALAIDSYIQGAIGHVSETADTLVYTSDGANYGPDSFTYTIVDNEGRKSTATVRITVRNSPDQLPVAQLLNLDCTTGDCYGLDPMAPEASVKLVNQAFLEVRGIADDADANDAFSYDLEIQPLEEWFHGGGGQFLGVPVVTRHGVVRVSTQDVLGGGSIDLRSVNNGLYEVILTVKSGDKTAIDKKRILLQKEYKPGNLKFSENDLTVKVAGVPLKAIRSYDSLNGLAAKGGDFGPGWVLSLTDLQVEVNETRETVEDLWDESFSRRSGGGRDISLTMPDSGRRVTFRFRLGPPVFSGGISSQDALWDAPPGVTATLRSAQPEIFRTEITPFGTERLYWNGNQSTHPDRYDISGFVLALADGTEYHLIRKDLGEHEYLLEGNGDQNPVDWSVHAWGKISVNFVKQPTGDEYFFSDNGVDHKSPGQGQAVPCLRFERQGGLITAIHDANSLNSEGFPVGDPAVIYEYETVAEGSRLVKVRRLQNRPSQENPNLTYDTTTYQYTNSNRPFLITGVLDPLGNPMAKTTYDDAGRLSRVEKADGRWIEHYYDDPPEAIGAASRERTVDSEGNITIKDLDARGNPLLVIDALENRTEREFDDKDTQLDEIMGNSDLSESLQTRNDILYYEDSDQIKRMLTTEVGTEQHRFVQEFDTKGKLTRSIDVKNTKITDADQDPFDSMHPEWTPDFWMEYEYDSATGQPTKTIAKWRNPAKSIEISQVTYFEMGMFKGYPEKAYSVSGGFSTFDYYGENELDGRFGDLKSVTTSDSSGPQTQTTYKYDSSGNRTHQIRMIRSGGSWINYSDTETKCDAQSRIIETIDAKNGHTYTSYDANGRVESTTDRYGGITHYTYDIIGELIETEYPEVKPGTSEHAIVRTSTYYDTVDTRMLKHVIEQDRHFPSDTAVNGNQTIYDELDRPILTRRLQNVVIDLVSTGNGLKSVFQKANAIEKPASETKYDFAGRPFLTSDTTGKWTKREYDDKGRQWRSKAFVDSDGNDTADTITDLTGYDESDRQLWTLDANQYAAMLVIDGTALSGTPEQVNSALYGTSENPSVYRSRLTCHEYDEFGRAVRVTHPSADGAVPAATVSKYDDAGRRWLEIDADGNATAFVYDALGRLTWVITDVDCDPEPPTALPSTMTHSGLEQWAKGDRAASDSTATHYEYDDLGRLRKQTDAMLHYTTFEYDELDRRTRRTLPDQASYQEWDYDHTSPVDGIKVNKVRYRDFAGQFIVSSYDIAGRLLSRLPEGRTGGATFTYTPTGQRATMTDNVGGGADERLTRYVYDEFDRLRVKLMPEGTLYYRYDIAGKVEEISAQYSYSAPGNVFDENALSLDRPAGAHMTYGYDGRDRLQSVNSTDVAYTYDDSGNLKTVVYGNNTQTTYNYNIRNQLKDISATTLSDPVSFVYDDAAWSSRRLSAIGLRRQMQENIGGVTRTVQYDYDTLRRLTREDITAGPNVGTITYDSAVGYGDTGFDKVGNRRSRTVVGLATPATGLNTVSYADYDVNDRIGNTGTAKVRASFDPNGNTSLADLNADGNWDSTVGDQYDFDNHLIEAVRPAGTVTMFYDGDGNRIRKSVGGTTTYYLVDDRNPTGYAQVLEESTTLAGTPTVTYVYGCDLVSQTRSGITHYYGYDGLGSVRYLTDGNGELSDTYTYDAFGFQIADWHGTTATVNSYRYGGEQLDEDLGAYYLRARYYHPNLGRFWSQDTFEGYQGDPISLHKYLYCHGNPVNGIDPSGQSFLVELTVNAAIKGTIAAFTFGAVNGAFTYAKTRSLEAAMFSAGQTAAITYLAFVSPAAAVSLGIGGAGAIGLGVYNGDITVQDTPEFAAYAAVGIGLSIAFRNPAFLEFEATTTVSAETAMAAGGADAARMMQIVGKLKNWDWSTPKDKAVFYSGRGNDTAAASYAKNNGAFTIEETVGGRALLADADFLALSKTEQYAVWRAASLYYARAASGRVTAFVSGSRAEGVFSTVEEPILRANQQRNIVTQIEYAR